MKASITLLAAATTTVFGFNAAQAQGPGQNPPGVNPEHYACYRVAPAKPFKQQKVKLTDQFGSGTVTVVRETMLCAPVSKNGQPIKDERTHLLCYTVEGKNALKGMSVTNQFGTAVYKADRIMQLCVPSLKKLL
jgi:hypothetical protein